MFTLAKVKPIEEFLADPAAFLAFKSFISMSRLSMEFMEFLLFWEDVCTCPTPLTRLGRGIQRETYSCRCQRYFCEIFGR